MDVLNLLHPSSVAASMAQEGGGPAGNAAGGAGNSAAGAGAAAAAAAGADMPA